MRGGEDDAHSIVVPATLLPLLAWPALDAAAQQKAMSDEELIANATSAAPEAVAQHAAVMAMDADGKMRTLREGTNNFTCMPDNPKSPGDDPMCLDQNGMEWAHAWMTNTAPPAGKVGFGYMLQGGSDASNEDPHATGPAAGRGVGRHRAARDAVQRRRHGAGLSLAERQSRTPRSPT